MKLVVAFLSAAIVLAAAAAAPAQGAAPLAQASPPPPQPAPSSPSSAPDAGSGTSDGEEILGRVCSSCHESTVATGARRPAQDWPPLIERMRSIGANLSDAEAKSLLDYLVAHYSTAQ